MKTSNRALNHPSKNGGLAQLQSSELPGRPSRRWKRSKHGGEFKVIWINDSPAPYSHIERDSDVDAYWRQHIPSAAWFDPSKECFVTIILDRRNKIIGHNLVSIGTVSACLLHAREVFRPAIAAAGSSVILTHNHPAGDPTPSHADLSATTQMIQAGIILGIDVTDHVIIGEKFFSIRKSGLCNFDPNSIGQPFPVRMNRAPLSTAKNGKTFPVVKWENA